MDSQVDLLHGLLARHPTFELLEPILNDVHLRDQFRGALARLNEEELSTVGAYIVRACRSVHFVSSSEQLRRDAKRKDRLHRDRDRHDACLLRTGPDRRQVLSHVEEFLAVRAPDGRNASVTGDLITRSTSGITLNVHLKPPGFIRVIRNPAPVWRYIRSAHRRTVRSGCKRNRRDLGLAVVHPRRAWRS